MNTVIRLRYSKKYAARTRKNASVVAEATTIRLAGHFHIRCEHTCIQVCSFDFFNYLQINFNFLHFHKIASNTSIFLPQPNYALDS